MAAERINFTKKALEALAVPEGKDRLVVYDVKVPALSLVVRGNKTFYIYRRIDGRPQRIRLGEFPELTVDQARTAAEATVGEIARGENPAEKKRKARGAWTLEELLNHYIDTHGKLHKKTWEDDRAQFE